MSVQPCEFDDAIIVDWSASAIPKTGPDSCWVATGPLNGRPHLSVKNYATRIETMAAIEQRVARNLRARRRTILAIDVSFGFPAGATRILGLNGKPQWRALWSALEARVTDDERNKNNRFDVADALNAECGTRVFWGRPVAPSFDYLKHLSVKNVDIHGLAPNPLPRLRACEKLAGPGVISNWMLVGKGSVGGQVLTCLPYLERFRLRHGDDVAVWPFDGLGDGGVPVVVAETWFGLFDWKHEQGSCRDERQVRGTHKALRAHGPKGIAELLTPGSLTAMPAHRYQEILNEEGWTFGVR